MGSQHLTEEELDALRQIDTCMVANAIEGSTSGCATQVSRASIRCIFPDAPDMWVMPPRPGCAAVSRRSGWHIPRPCRFVEQHSSIPAPRILVLEDMDDPPGRGAFIGGVHAAILKALGCVGIFDQWGSARAAFGAHRWEFSCLPAALLSRTLTHIFSILALRRRRGHGSHPGDLLHGDVHGVLIRFRLQSPLRFRMLQTNCKGREQKIVEFCRSSYFSVAKLSEVMKTTE